MGDKHSKEDNHTNLDYFNNEAYSYDHAYPFNYRYFTSGCLDIVKFIDTVADPVRYATAQVISTSH